MKRLPARPNLGQLKKQAKDLLAQVRNGDTKAIARFRQFLPAAAAGSLADNALRLRDAQSCIAREYGFPSWPDLKSFVEARNATAADPVETILNLWRLLYAGDIVGGTNRAQPHVAARVIGEQPELANADPYLACAVGDEATLRRETARDPAWVKHAGGPLTLPPLVAVTHSSLGRLPAYRDRLHASARLLLEAGADPNQSVANRWAASPDTADERNMLSALYGAAGQNHDPALTKLLLEHGANPNDGESLYHALENPACTSLLLEAGARVTGSNALYRALDLDDVTPLRLLLAHGGDANEPPSGPPASDWGTPLLWAIRRRRSPAHIEALLAAGADPLACTPRGESAELLALKFGLPEVARRLRAASGKETALSAKDAFIAASARGDAAAARDLLAGHTGLIAALAEPELRLLPELAAQGAADAVRTMVELGWPIDARGGDWKASALNHAVFRGDASLARFLLEHGAQWTEEHGFGDNVLGSLSWASCNEPVEGGDWAACAVALRAHGVPGSEPDPQGTDAVVTGGVRRRFSDEVTEILLAPPPSPASTPDPNSGP
ncbi:ankyrin repeat domain-containing protein [Hyphomicrobium sp.]|uniref:ankyrin repeat domain-containing protein n=1 Tax=Hyphomicrobium sp. TaxID=82 RepID=UPI003F6EAEE0